MSEKYRNKYTAKQGIKHKLIAQRKNNMSKKNYVINCQYILDRVNEETYGRVHKITKKWEGAPSGSRDRTCGNVYGELTYNKKTKSFEWSKDGKWVASDPSFCQVMPSALWLYRIMCLFECNVDSYGPEGYKAVWAVGLQHKATKKTVAFGEHKGGAGFYLPEGSSSQLNAEFKADLLELVNLLVSKDCPHPYDGTIAGSVA